MPIDPNPIFDFGWPTWIEVVAVADTPQEMTSYSGRFLSVPAATPMPQLGTRGVVIVSGVSVPGYLRQGPGGYEWVMMPPIDPVEALVDRLPGPLGWANPEARSVWINIGLALRGLGVGGADLDYGLPRLFQAARAELGAQQ